MTYLPGSGAPAQAYADALINGNCERLDLFRSLNPAPVAPTSQHVVTAAPLNP